MFYLHGHITQKGTRAVVLVTFRHLLRPQNRHSLTIDVRKVSTGGGVAFDGVQMRVLNGGMAGSLRPRAVRISVTCKVEAASREWQLLPSSSAARLEKYLTASTGGSGIVQCFACRDSQPLSTHREDIRRLDCPLYWYFL